MAEQNNNKALKSMRSYQTVRSIKSLKLKKDTKINRIHIVVDLFKCDDKSLSKASLMEQKVKKILNQFNLEPKIKTFYQFKPFGVTAIVCAEGLQLTLHTWPEYNSAALDLYSFSGSKKATQVCDQIKQMFKSTEHTMRVRKR